MSSFFTDTILERGKKYFEQNRVFSVNQKDDQTYTAIVLGSEAYHTKITLDEHYNVMSATCDCPYANEGHHCKHEAALYFAIEERLPKDEKQYIDINDLSMIKVAGLGVGVQNTVEDMKKECDVITKATNNENAVAEVISKYILGTN